MIDMLVTGAGGQLGREWGHYLYAEGATHTLCSSSDLDITDPLIVAGTLNRMQPDVVVNCAAYTDVDGAEDNPELAMRVNCEGVKHLAGWCSENGALLVQFSTDYVFPGNVEDLVRYPDGYPEQAATGPVNRYGESKLAGEQALVESGCDYILVRVSWLCGQYGSNFVTTMLRLGRQKDRLQVVNDQLGSPSYTGSVVELTHRLLEQGEKGIFHITSAGIISWYDFAIEIFRRAGQEVEAEPVSSARFTGKAARPAFSKLNTTKICRTLEVEMVPWQHGLQMLIGQLD